MGERRTDYATRDRIEEIQRWLARWIRRIAILFALMVLCLVVSAVLFYVQNGRTRTLNDDIVRSNSQRITQIQFERRRNTLTNCQESNRRHDTTIRALDRIINKRIRDTPVAKRKQVAIQLRTARDANVQLITALAPKRDCKALVERTVGTHRTDKP